MRVSKRDFRELKNKLDALLMDKSIDSHLHETLREMVIMIERVWKEEK